MIPSDVDTEDRIITLADRFVPRFEIYFSHDQTQPTPGATAAPVDDEAGARQAEADRIKSRIYRATPGGGPPSTSDLVPLAGPWGDRPDQQTNDVLGVEFTEGTGGDQKLATVKIELLNVYDYRTGVYRYTDVPKDEGAPGQGPYPLMQYGTTIALLIGYDTVEPMFEGMVSKLEVSFPADGPSKVTVTAVDKRDRLRSKKDLKARTFSNMSEEQIAAAVAAEVGLTVATRPGQKTMPNGPVKVPQDQDALQFLTDRAKKASLELSSFGNTIFLLTPGDAATGGLRYGYRRGLSSLTPKFDGNGKPTKVRVVSRDPTSGQTFKGEATTDDLKKMGLAPPDGSTALDTVKGSGQSGERVEVVTNYLAKSNEEAKQIAIGILKRNLDDAFTVEGEMIGDPAVRIGTNMQIDGVGRFSGRYYIDSTTHKMGAQGYRTSFGARKNSPPGVDIHTEQAPKPSTGGGQQKTPANQPAPSGNNGGGQGQ
jgi:uncharacterized protein